MNGLFLFHWNKVCTSENTQKLEKSPSVRSNARPGLVPVEYSTGTGTGTIFLLNQNPIFCSLGPQFCYCKREIPRFLFLWNKKSEQALTY